MTGDVVSCALSFILLLFSMPNPNPSSHKTVILLAIALGLAIVAALMAYGYASIAKQGTSLSRYRIIQLPNNWIKPSAPPTNAVPQGYAPGYRMPAPVKK